MTVTLTLKPDIEAGLAEQAQALGLTVEAYLLSIVEDAASRPTRVEAVRRMLEFGEKYRLNLGQQVTRTLLHEDHRL